MNCSYPVRRDGPAGIVPHDPASDLLEPRASIPAPNEIVAWILEQVRDIAGGDWGVHQGRLVRKMTGEKDIGELVGNE